MRGVLSLHLRIEVNETSRFSIGVIAYFCIYFATLMNPQEILFGQIALHLKLLRQDQISQCLAEQAHNPKLRLGEVCIRKGLLTNDQVALILQHQQAILAKRGDTTVSTPTKSAEKTESPVTLPPPARREAPAVTVQPNVLAPPPSVEERQRVAPTIQPATPATTQQSPSTIRNAPSPAKQPVNGSQASSTVEPAKSVALAEKPLQVDPRLVECLAQAQHARASDVHIFADRPVAYRVAGQLLKEGRTVSSNDAESMLMSLIDTRRREQLKQHGYTDFAADLAGAGRFRVNVGRQSTGLKGCFRVIPPQIPTLSVLGLPEMLNNVSLYHQGLAVVAGPNGQGKSTTLAAIVNQINLTKARHIITVEDPVEFIYPVGKSLVSQREVGVHTRSFARALKAALREDPDVVVIGELRDVETVEIALEAAETGHLVVATMSTRSAAKTIDRLIDMFPPELQTPVRNTLAGTLKIVVSQKLITGSDGRSMVAAAELITGNVQLWNLIRDNKLIQLPSLMQRGAPLGMLRLDVSLKQLVQQGKITEAAALENAEHPQQLKQELNPQATTSTVGASPSDGTGTPVEEKAPSSGGSTESAKLKTTPLYGQAKRPVEEPSAASNLMSNLFRKKKT